MEYSVQTYGRAVLREKARRVERVDDGIRQLADDMLRTMYANRGLGLAAEQVGRTEAICVIDVPPSEAADDNDVPMPLVLINPVITAAEGQQSGPEGCLSFPEIFVTIARAADVDVTFADRDGREQALHATGLLARAIQHELDHLNGVLLVDRMSPVQKVAASGKLKRIKREAREG